MTTLRDGDSQSLPKSLPLLVIVLFALMVSGCSTFGLTDLFPGRSGNSFSDTARRTRQPYPADIPRELNKSPHPPYVLEPGDGLLIQPEDLDSPVRLPNDQVVMPDGTIDLGEYGRLLVAGKPMPQVEEEVRAMIARQEEEPGWISIRLINRQSKVFYVLGEVNTPGSFPLSGRETVLDAILAAGGLTTKASKDNIILSRPTPPEGPRVVLPICYTAIVQLGDTSTNYQLSAGDRIYVPRGNVCEFWFGKPCEKRDGTCNHVAASQKPRRATLAAPIPITSGDLP